MEVENPLHAAHSFILACSATFFQESDAAHL
jgi:hypothetical protein